MRLGILASVEAFVAYATCALALLVLLCSSPPRGRRRVTLQRATWVMLIGAVLVVLSATLVGSTIPAGGPGGRVNLVPGASILALNQDDKSDAVENVLGNVLLFLPLGFFGVLVVRRALVEVTGAACAMSVCIETTQWVLGNRWTDIDDVLLNTFGAFVGAVAALAAVRVFERRRQPKIS
jgi:glycopeptide antibiotics resistance protein